MPFPANLEALQAAGYVYSHWQVCPECGEGIEVWKTPGKRELAMQPMCELLRPAIRHYLTCAPKQEEAKPAQGSGIKLCGVRDKNMIAVGWQDGTLKVAFRFGTYLYANVAEDAYLKIKKNPYPNALFVKLVKNHPELCPCTKVA